MNKSLVWIIAGCVRVVLCVGCAGPEEKAGKLLAEASQLVHSAQETEKTSYSDALKLYQDSLARAEAIPIQYPSSPVATKLTQGGVKVGSYTLTELKGTIVPQARLKAEAEESPLAGARLIVRTIEETSSRANIVAEIATKYADAGQYDQALQVAHSIEGSPSKIEALLAIARKYAEAGAAEKATEIFIQALWIANSVEDDSEEGRDAAWARAWALRQVADEYLRDGQYDQALTIAKTMKDDTPKTGVLAGIASQYAEEGAQERAAELLSQALQIAKTRQGAEAKAQALAIIGFSYTKAGLKVDDHAKKILRDMIAGLGERAWREQPPEAEERKPKRSWGLVDGVYSLPSESR